MVLVYTQRALTPSSRIRNSRWLQHRRLLMREEEAPPEQLSLPTPSRSTPIITTGLSFMVQLDSDGAIEVRSIA